ncbi:MAG: glutaredoxin family protein [archaeon]
MQQVTIYSTPACVYCGMAKKFFAEHNVKYNEYNVSEDSGKAEEMIEKSGQSGVPVIEIGKKVIVGFDKQAIKEALRLK